MAETINERLSRVMVQELRHMAERFRDVYSEELRRQGDDRAADKLKLLEVQPLLVQAGALPLPSDGPGMDPELMRRMEKVEMDYADAVQRTRDVQVKLDGVKVDKERMQVLETRLEEHTEQLHAYRAKFGDLPKEG